MFKKITILGAVIAVSLIFTQVQARTYSTTHIFSSGDVISADMMNELFSQLENINKSPVTSDLAGTWGLVQVSCAGGEPGNCTTSSQVTVPGAVASTDGLTWSRSDTVTIVDDGFGLYNWTQATYSSFLCNGHGPDAGTGRVSVANGFALFKDETGGTNVPGGDDGICAFTIKKVSPTRMQLSINSEGSFNVILLDKQSLPPLNPTTLTIAQSGLVNTLTWVDNSDDEVSFDIYKKSSAKGSWILIDSGSGLTVIADVTTYEDTVSEAGDYWYRVRATNTDGPSIGSKVIKVSNTEN